MCCPSNHQPQSGSSWNIIAYMDTHLIFSISHRLSSFLDFFCFFHRTHIFTTSSHSSLHSSVSPLSSTQIFSFSQASNLAVPFSYSPNVIFSHLIFFLTVISPLTVISSSHVLPSPPLTSSALISSLFFVSLSSPNSTSVRQDPL